MDFGFGDYNWMRRWKKQEQPCWDTLCMELWMVTVVIAETCIASEGLGLSVEKGSRDGSPLKRFHELGLTSFSFASLP